MENERGVASALVTSVHAGPVEPNSGDADADQTAALPGFAVKSVLALAVAKLAMQCAFLTGYGWHRDEFYYLVGGRHLAPGYVDHPLLTPWVARGVAVLFGSSLGALRLVPALLGAGMVMLAGLLAREFGGDRRAQVVTALLVVLDPLLIATDHLFQTVPFDQLAWIAAAFGLVRLIRTGEERWWLLVGAACGFGLLAKANIVVWMLGLAIGLILTPARRHLRSPWFGAAAGLVVLGGLPFLWFQLEHGWPFLEFSRNLNDLHAGEERPKFIPGQLLLNGPVAAFVWVPGLIALFRDRALRTYRVVGWAFVIAFVVFFVTGGKAYYLGPAYVVLFAVGATFLSRHWQRLPRLLIVGLVVSTLVVLPALLPVLPAKTFADSPYGALNGDALEEVGWQQFVRQVSHVVEEHHATMVITDNYGEAGALNVLGDLHVPVRSRQNSYWLWGQVPPHPRTTFTLVGFGPGEERGYFRTCQTVTRIDNGRGIENDEQGTPVSVCRGLERPWKTVWSRLRAYR